MIDPYVAGRRDEAALQYQRWLPLINYENRQCGLLAAKALMKEGGVIACDAPRHPFPPLQPGRARRPAGNRAAARPDGVAMGEMTTPAKRLRRLPQGAETGHERSSGPFVPGEEPGHWPGAACKAAGGPAEPDPQRPLDCC